VVEPDEEAAKVEETAVVVAADLERAAEKVAADLERVAEEVAARLGEEISAALVAASKQVEVAVEMVKTESEARKNAFHKERTDRRRGLMWVAPPMVVALIAAGLAASGFVTVRREAVVRERAAIQRNKDRCEDVNKTNAGVLTLLNGLLDLGQKRDSTLPPDQVGPVVAGRAESKALGARTLPQTPC